MDALWNFFLSDLGRSAVYFGFLLKKQGYTGKKLLGQTRFIVFVLAVLTSIGSIILKLLLTLTI
jgi:hypothetical protein